MSQLLNDLSGQFDKLPPHSLDAERSLLASMMLDPVIISTVRAALSRDAFYQADHQLIFDTLLEMNARQVSIDILTVREQLVKGARLEEIGGQPYLVEVLSSVPTAAHWRSYLDILVDCHKCRETIAICNEGLRNAYARNSSGQELLTTLASSAATASATAGRQYRHFGAIITDALGMMASGGVPRIPTGFHAIDRRTGGFGLGEVVVVGARPSMGKSMFARQLALNMAFAGEPGGIFAREETGYKIAKNAISLLSSVKNSRMRKPEELTPELWERINKAASELKELPIQIDERTGDVDDICAVIPSWVAKYGLKWFIVDHIGRVRGKGKDTYSRVSYVSEKLAACTHDLNVVGILCAQLGRDVLKRDDKRPNLNDLRDSGRIEEDADVALFLHREDYYHTKEPDYVPDSTLEVICEKWRDAERGWTAKLKAELPYQRLLNPAEGDESPFF